MISLAAMTEDLFLAGKTDEAWDQLQRVPRYQLEIWWDVFEPYCRFRLQAGIPPRPVNGLNVEIGSPLPRCSNLDPDGLGLRYFLSGGAISAYGICCRKDCILLKNAPILKKQEKFK